MFFFLIYSVRNNSNTDEKRTWQLKKKINTNTTRFNQVNVYEKK